MKELKGWIRSSSVSSEEFYLGFVNGSWVATIARQYYTNKFVISIDYKPLVSFNEIINIVKNNKEYDLEEAKEKVQELIDAFNKFGAFQ